VAYLPQTDRGQLHIKNVDDPSTFWKRRGPAQGLGLDNWRHVSFDGVRSGLHVDKEPEDTFPIHALAVCAAHCDDVPGAVQFLKRYMPFYGGGNFVVQDAKGRSVAIDRIAVASPELDLRRLPDGTLEATRSIDLEMAYFIPDELALAAIQAALRRGVRVRIIMPGRHNDAQSVRRASRALWGDLLEAGAEIYEYQPTMFHCKVLVADWLIASVGSTNFDDRSFRLNDEASLNIYDAGFAMHQVEVFERDLKSSRRISVEEWRNRPLAEKLWEHAAALLGPQL
jgi:phosphatidylserine/phosphatidylglycerophosphate/cardiolipin synthase-like enzyme